MVNKISVLDTTRKTHKMIKTLLKASLILAASLTTSLATAADNWIIKDSNNSVSVTADKLIQAIEGAGATVFARIDHAAGAEKVGLEMEAATLVIFGNPKLGTPIMNANPRAGIDLPIRVLIWSQDSKVQLGALSPESFQERHSLEGVDGPLKKMGGALNKLMGAAAE